jgi:hypothetical protein
MVAASSVLTAASALLDGQGAIEPARLLQRLAVWGGVAVSRPAIAHAGYPREIRERI